MIALLGGASGVVLAYWSLRLFVSLSAGSIARLDTVELSVEVLLFTLGVSIVAALFFGFAPALHSSRSDLHSALRDEGRSSAGSAVTNRIQSTLVIGEVALALILVVLAGLLLKSFSRLINVDPGFNSSSLLLANVALPTSQYRENEKVTAFYDQLIDRLASHPEVRSVAAASLPPLAGSSGDTIFHVEGRPMTEDVDQNGLTGMGHVYYWQVTPGYIETMGISLINGRTIRDSDTATSPPVTVISETTARRFWPNENPIGRKIRLFWSADQLGTWMEIVGIVRDVPINNLNEEIQPELYVSQDQGPIAAGWVSRGMTLAIRTEGDPMLLAGSVRSAVKELDSAAPVARIRTMEDLVSQTVSGRRFNLTLLAIFAAIALILAAIGVYAVLAQSVRQRTREIGIRIALGASGGEVFRLIVGHGMKVVGVGLAIGLAASPCGNKAG